MWDSNKSLNVYLPPDDSDQSEGPGVITTGDEILAWVTLSVAS